MSLKSLKGHLGTLVFLVLAIGLGLWIWFDRDKVSEGERSRREHNVFSAWRREDLSRIEIAHDGETIVLVRDPKHDGTWRMLAPREERADQAAAERLLTTLEFASIVRKVADDAKLGFDAPRATGSVTMGALVYRFQLGGPSPRPEGSSYLRVDDGEPFVASKELADTLLARSDTYRDRTVVPYLSLELTRFEVKHPAGGFAVERSDERSFKVQGLGILASRVALDKVWGALAEMRAETFPKDADADRLTAAPVLSITMTPKEGTTGELVIGAACPGHPNDVVVLRRQPKRVAACAPKGALNALLAMTPEALVDKRVFSFRHDEVEEFRLERLGAPDAGAAAPRAFEIARRGTGFHEREPVDRELGSEETDAANELLTQIEHAEATEVRPGGGPFTALARARVRSGDHDETVEIGGADGSSVVRRLRDDARLTVSSALARRLLPRATTARARTIVNESRRVTRVILRCGTPQELVDQGTGLKLVEPAGYETDGSITQLVDGLLKGKAIAWVADADDGSFGLGSAPRSADGEKIDDCRAILAFEDGNAPLTFRFGAEGEGGIYATIEGHPEIFVAPRSLHELVKRIYVNRAALREEPSRIEAVKVTLSGKPAPGMTKSVAALRDAAGALFADRVATLGSADVGPAEIEIVMTIAEGGPKKRVVCGPVVGLWRKCATPGVKAVFDVHPSVLNALVSASDAGASASDAGKP